MPKTYSLAKVAELNLIGFDDPRTIKGLIESKQLFAIPYRTPSGILKYKIPESSIKEFLSKGDK